MIFDTNLTNYEILWKRSILDRQHILKRNVCTHTFLDIAKVGV